MNKLLDIDSEEFIKKAANLALSHMQIIQCNDCGDPVVDGYCCTNCGNDNPSRHYSEPLMLSIE